jgi:hypothetical protein
MGQIKPFGVVLGLLGNIMIAFAMHKLLAAVSCTANLESLGGCTNDITGSTPILVIGIFISMGAIFAGGGGVTFLGIFFAIGIGALIASFGAHDSFVPGFGKLFGGIFVAVPALLLVLWLFGASWGRGQRARAQNLVATGARGVGTVVGVSDTGVTVNDNPRVKITMRIAPEDSSTPFDVQKTVTVSRVSIPRAGDRFPVFYDRKDRNQWAYGTGLGATQAPAPVQPLFAPVAAPAADSVAELEKLGALHRSGALSDAEFAAAKAKILGTA